MRTSDKRLSGDPISFLWEDMVSRIKREENSNKIGELELKDALTVSHEEVTALICNIEGNVAKLGTEKKRGTTETEPGKK